MVTEVGCERITSDPATLLLAAFAIKDGLINATGKRSNRIRRAEGAQIADFLPVSAVCGVLPGLQA
ncbi:hypothetical protein, partial [Xanthomonas vasicola]|uniref:hypothetical protein n=1 Tax=Xanthomonas vasicola TaxID=56459 RepID=UPI001C1F0FA1